MCVMRTAESVLLMCWPPAPRGAVGVDAQVGRVDLDLDRVVDLGIDEHARERGVAAARWSRTGSCAPGGARRSRCAGSRRRSRRSTLIVALLMPATSPAVSSSTSALKPLRSQYLQVHAQQHRRPVLRLGAAGAGLDVDEAVARVERVGEHAAELERRRRRFRASRRRRRRRRAWRRRLRRARCSNSSRAVARARCRARYSVPTTPSSAFFSLPSSCARFWSFQTLGSSSSRRRLARRSALHIEVKDTSAARRTVASRSASDAAIWLMRSASTFVSLRAIPCARPNSALPGGSAPRPRAGRAA